MVRAWYIITIDNKNNPRSLDGLQEHYNDFDNWVIKLVKVVERSSLYANIKKTTENFVERRKINGNILKNDKSVIKNNIPPLEDMFVKGFLELRQFKRFVDLTIEPNDDFLLDYVIFRFTYDNKCFQQIKSKL